MENEIPQEKVNAVVDYLVDKGLTAKDFQASIDKTNDYYKMVAEFIAKNPGLSVEELAVKFDEEQKMLAVNQNNHELNDNEQPEVDKKEENSDERD